MNWFRIRFRLSGNLHVGSGRWGYVRSGRPYLPGWTLWGALTNFCKRNGKINGQNSFTGVGNYLDRNFWLGHLSLVKTLDDGKDAAYLPVLDQASGRTIFCWQTDNRLEAPLRFRPGVVRGRQDNDPRGRHFLTETIGSGWLKPYHLEGWYLSEINEKLPIDSGDWMPVGGNRQTSGAIITLVEHVCDNTPKDSDLRRCSHYRLESDSPPPVTGTVERVVMRRTKEGKGFGHCVIDWGPHAAPGWQFSGKNVELSPVKKVKDGNDIYYHGTVHSTGAETHAAS